MRVILDVLQGPRKGRTFVFDRHDTFIVGRSRFVHCPMPEDSALSRDHFLVEVNPPRCELRDLGSTNGTFVNDKKAEGRVRLNPGDKIEAGQSVFAIRIEPSKSDAEQKTRTVALGPAGSVFTCAACGVKAPPGVDVASDADASMGDSIQWLCDLCRGEVATSPQPVPTYTTI